ncbi:MAG TPA: alpha-hydroxy acid oxidase [Candidatus Cybelea sp.]|nr:alpha-hydroxy acid oxidase [Candidatus Cybelea sp.]
MRLDRVINIEDLRRQAKRRLPRIAFDFIEGGLEDEHGLERNEKAFLRHALMPKYMVDVSKIDQSATLFGKTYASPFGIAPTGLAGLFRRGADLMLAEAAASANIPFFMSGASTASIEEMAKVAPQHGAYQLYGARDRKISEDLIRRCRDAGFQTLMVTVDVPVTSKRERNIRNGFTRPLRMTIPTYAEALLHPAWIVEYLSNGGMPVFSNWAAYAGANARPEEIANYLASQTPASDQTWRDFEMFRRLWPGKLIVKGIMRADDAVRCVEIGAEGILVSNHGGRQLDRAPSPLEVLPGIRAAVRDRAVLLLDGGVRRGSDILIAWALGARFVLVGRATLYGASAYGLPGVKKAIAILQGEIELVMKQMGCPSLDKLGADFLLDAE